MDNKKSPEQIEAKNEKVQITLRMPEDIANSLKYNAKRQGISTNAYILLLINKAINLH